MMTGKLKTLLKAGLLTGLMSLCSVSEAGWPLFDEFKAVSMEGGRVIDYSDPRHITTSEGQSYALFFALVAGDRQTFDDIWQWTKSHLMAESALPAWLYGKLPLSEDPQRPSDATGVLDDNNATDSDLWIAYSLLEAARIFKEPAYREEALKLMEALKGCTRKVPHLGLILLPGLQGFEDENAYLFNPSYCPYFLLSRLALSDLPLMLFRRALPALPLTDSLNLLSAASVLLHKLSLYALQRDLFLPGILRDVDRSVCLKAAGACRLETFFNLPEDVASLFRSLKLSRQEMQTFTATLGEHLMRGFALKEQNFS